MKQIQGKFALLIATALVAQTGSANVLYPGVTLSQNQSILSLEGKYRLIMQSDGNLVVYRADGTPRWSSGAKGTRAVMQEDGNFVQYGVFGNAAWHTNTWGNPGAALVIQDDGNLVIYAAQGRGPLWAIGVDTPWGAPQRAGDVVGRDLDVPLLGAIGHIAIWDGNKVYEAVAGYDKKAIRSLSWNQFQTTTKYWGAAFPYIPAGVTQPVCLHEQCPWFYVPGNSYFESFQARRAMTEYMAINQEVGAEYTLSAIDYHPYQAGLLEYNFPPKIGLFRCDTFVIEMMRISTDRASPTTASETWRKRWQSLSEGPVLPGTVFNKLKSFQ